MIRWKSLKRSISKLLGSLMLMIAGAWLLKQYIAITQPSLIKGMNDIELCLVIGFWLTYAGAELLQPQRRSKQTKEPAPRWSGSAVVITTGLAGAFYVSKGDADNKVLWITLIALGTVVVAAIVWRFATVHAGEIGEAVFTSRSTDGV